MKKIVLFTVIIGVVAASCTEQKRKNIDSQTLRLDSLFNHEHISGRFDGTVVIGKKGVILYEKAIGISNRVWNIPMRLDHRFDICSINKSFVATLILIAVEEGRLSLDDRLVDHLEVFSYSGKFNPDITIHQMLTHTSGLPDYGQTQPDLSENLFRMFKRKHFTNAEYVDFISNVQAVNDPGVQFYYSNFAYHLLIILLEGLYQLPFPELLDQKLCKPLGLLHTFSTVSNGEVFEKMVEGYNYEETTDSWKRNQFIDLTLGRRIFSTAHDLYLWGLAMDSPSILSVESARLMHANHLKDITYEFSYGYGWVVFDGKRPYRMGDLGIDRKYIIHGGATEGFKSMLINIENGEYIVAFLANTGDQTNEMELAKKIANILINSENEN
ncbi:serine hydrolase domain-containing protein [Negadavirga shengliensis]|uniref:Serine hydrolase domain-containing protein n=1 Tax=Negadavirga shengliensis TaxID=1389218 RepID=A0ABV9T811_9BACT